MHRQVQYEMGVRDTLEPTGVMGKSPFSLSMPPPLSYDRE